MYLIIIIFPSWVLGLCRDWSSRHFHSVKNGTTAAREPDKRIYNDTQNMEKSVERAWKQNIVATFTTRSSRQKVSNVED